MIEIRSMMRLRRSLEHISRGAPTQCLYNSARQRLAALRPSLRARSQSHQSVSTASSPKPVHGGRTQRRSAISSAFAPRDGAQPPRKTPSYWRGLKTIQQADSKQRFGPFSMVSAAVFVGAGFGLYYYFRWEKERMERKRIAEVTKGVGRPKVGGTFELTDQDGKIWSSSEKMHGKYSLVYFGFSHCPDICPEELDKMASMLDIVKETVPAAKGNPQLLPIFITCDPARDTPAVLKTYLREFHPDMIGLTGAWEQIKTVCRLYRVYFSTPAGVKPGQDYLVDHSIYFYLMDPEGDFVEAIGRQHTAEQGASLIINHMSDWRGEVKTD